MLITITVQCTMYICSSFLVVEEQLNILAVVPEQNLGSNYFYYYIDILTVFCNTIFTRGRQKWSRRPAQHGYFFWRNIDINTCRGVEITIIHTLIQKNNFLLLWFLRIKIIATVAFGKTRINLFMKFYFWLSILSLRSWI